MCHLFSWHTHVTFDAKKMQVTREIFHGISPESVTYYHDIYQSSRSHYRCEYFTNYIGLLSLEGFFSRVINISFELTEKNTEIRKT